MELTVVIPTYNRCDLVSRAIQSALDQQWPKLEVILVDDASTDETADVFLGSFHPFAICAMNGTEASEQPGKRVFPRLFIRGSPLGRR